MTLLHMDALNDALEERDWEKRLIVMPLLEKSQVGEASIDLRLATDFLLLRRTLRGGVELTGEAPSGARLSGEQVQARVDGLYEHETVAFGDGFWLHPQQFALGATFEFIRLPPTLGGYVLSRSTWGRLGLLVATAVMVQPGFAGALTLELVNEGDSPIKLYPGVKIAQLAIHAVPSPLELEKKEPTYRWPTGPQPARILKEHAQLEKIHKLGESLSQL